MAVDIWAEFHSSLVGFLHNRYGVGWDEVDDLVQETLLRVWKNYRDQQVKFSLVCTIALNHLRDVRRHEAIIRFEPLQSWGEGDEAISHTVMQLADPQAPAWFAEVEDYEQTAQRRAMIHEVLTNLPAHYALVLRKHYEDGVPHRELGAELGMSREAVKSMILRAKRAARAKVLRLSHEYNYS